MTNPSLPPESPQWAAIRPKVTAAGLAYAGALAAVAVLADLGVTLSTATVQAATGFLMLLAAYLWPER